MIVVAAVAEQRVSPPRAIVSEPCRVAATFAVVVAAAVAVEAWPFGVALLVATDSNETTVAVVNSLMDCDSHYCGCCCCCCCTGRYSCCCC